METLKPQEKEILNHLLFMAWHEADKKYQFYKANEIKAIAKKMKLKCLDEIELSEN